jgi:hypothetical protein
MGRQLLTFKIIKYDDKIVLEYINMPIMDILFIKNENFINGEFYIKKYELLELKATFTMERKN